MFAIIKTGSKQLKVSLGQEIFVEKLPVNEKDCYVFHQVLAIKDKSNILGSPFVSGAKVEAQVVKQGKFKKIIVATYKRRKKNRSKNGHRQFYTKLVITKIIV
ncbi:50S ribosomal protein L21 [Candidatus Phytoplasma melaleucae]|uniref:Large ribosomal subunit protein bL21 n=1 Tax=Candidatus Phytoplasma melaleucae TaxID=2982630 RepID=A0ABT9DE77_9MOLU|nr:50S ribosomal protein L21 ['Melaleuca sp.' phytoplasma]MDO8168143.1 50S ribosomal protein L21 ['Melaleuca sp.' phytoplasma]MDV3205229.1 50S ribosomal protein L21 [Weeping tea tree witches'-broom phytoplasma]